MWGNITMDVEEVVCGPGLDWSGSGEGQVMDCRECGDKGLCSMKCGKFLDYLWICQLLTKDSTVWSLLVQLKFYPGYYAQQCNRRGPMGWWPTIYPTSHKHTATKERNLKSRLQTSFLTAKSTCSRVCKFKSIVFLNNSDIFQAWSIVASHEFKVIT
jgi:hypothetical protein